MSSRSASACLLLCALLACATYAAAGPLKVNTSIKPPYSTHLRDGFLDRLLEEIFNRLQMDYDIVRLPPERALFAADEGQSDFELPRISGLGKQYENLIMIPEPVTQYTFVAFSGRQGWTNVNWNDFGAAMVGLILGWKIYEDIITPHTRHITATTPEQLFKLLRERRVDLALYERHAGNNLLCKNGIQARELSPPLEVRPMYMYANRKHERLVPLIADTIRAIKADGTYRRLESTCLTGTAPKRKGN